MLLVGTKDPISSGLSVDISEYVINLSKDTDN